MAYKLITGQPLLHQPMKVDGVETGLMELVMTIGGQHRLLNIFQTVTLKPEKPIGLPAVKQPKSLNIPTLIHPAIIGKPLPPHMVAKIPSALITPPPQVERL
jgi:hypothetical protein